MTTKVGSLSKTNKSKQQVVKDKASARSSVKKPANKTKKTLSKKTRKKSTKTTTKKRAFKSDVKIVTDAKKPTPKQDRDFAAKLEKMEATHGNKTAFTRESIHETLENKSLLVLPSYRFPLNVDVLAIQTARFAGAMFVLIGAVFSFYFTHVVNSDVFVAALARSTANIPDYCFDEGLPTEVIGQCESYEEYFLDEETLPEGQLISIDSSIQIEGSSPVFDLLPIYITTNPAEAVRVTVYETKTQKSYELGNAENQTDTEWKYLWDTTHYPDGEYKIKAYVLRENENEEIVSPVFLVENYPLDETKEIDAVATSTDSLQESATSSASGSTVTDETRVEPEIMSAHFSTTSPVAGKLTIEITALEAETVKLNIEELSTDVTTYLGYAYRNDKNTELWQFTLDTTEFVDGDYKLYIQAVSETGADDSYRKEFTIANKSDVTEEVTSNDDEEVSEPEAEDDALTDNFEPEINVSLPTTENIHEYIDVTIEVDSAIDFAEVHIQPVSAAESRFLGLAKQVDTKRWNYSWNTLNTPNGEYDLYTTIKNDYGSFDSSKIRVKVHNEVIEQQTDEEVALYTEPYESIAKEVDEALPPPPVSEVAEDTPTNTVVQNGNELTTNEAEAVDATEQEALRIIDIYREEIQAVLQRYAVALRSQDTEVEEQYRDKLFALQEEITSVLPAGPAKDHLVRTITEQLDEMVDVTKERAAKAETLVLERTGENVTKDSDSDGVTDFDEITIFKTDPFVADTDNDGFNDGVEILGGYNPTDSTSEALVVFESPKEAGVVREDVLVVRDVATATAEPGDTDGNTAEALIAGQGFPNSFVTLYIFSTPVVVTVKTDAEGAWVYRFDKELEDGEHEVYVGVTDNAGKIIAKSEPYRFIKQAEAFSGVVETTDPSNQTVKPQTSLTSNYMTYLVLSVSVVAIGLVLILVGVHLDGIRRKVQPELESVPEPSLL